MNRSGYSDDFEQQELAMWREAVASATRGKRGQKFLRELRDSLKALPAKRLIAEDMIKDGDVCLLGCIGAARGLSIGDMDPEDHRQLAKDFGIAGALVQEVEFMNDEGYHCQTPEARYEHMLRWVDSQIIEEKDETRKTE